MGIGKAIHGGRVQNLARERGISMAEVTDFSANINPLGPPESALLAIKKGIEDIRYYSDSEHYGVKHILSKKYHVEREEILCGNGAAEVLELFIRSLHPKRIFILEPAFSEYRAIAGRYNITIVTIDMTFHVGSLHFDKFKRILDRIDLLLNKGDLVIFNHPHNPSGMCWDREIWSPYILKWSKQGSYVILDESFIDFCHDEEEKTGLSLMKECLGLFIVRSATKMYSIPGLRFGFGFGNKEILKSIEDIRDQWSVNHLAQVAAAAAYQDEAFEYETHSWLKREQKFIKETWGQSNQIKVFPVHVNFFLAQFQLPAIAIQIQEHLERHLMPVRSCESFRGLDQSFIRVAIRTRSENQRLWDEVLTVLQKKG